MLQSDLYRRQIWSCHFDLPCRIKSSLFSIFRVFHDLGPVASPGLFCTLPPYLLLYAPVRQPSWISLNTFCSFLSLSYVHRIPYLWTLPSSHLFSIHLQQSQPQYYLTLSNSFFRTLWASFLLMLDLPDLCLLFIFLSLVDGSCLVSFSWAGQNLWRCDSLKRHSRDHQRIHNG